uniref:Uncharacterized protein n=1 Tax=Plocamiocolax pulvinatus TaxID=35206 RepID=E5Q3G9_9FLOR|nr:hypothetical protein PPUL_34 [Plocamiocolax pulvinata]ADR03252.1 hypothetical protein PPUL_34 [Plocamiocolax pulvinata]
MNNIRLESHYKYIEKFDFFDKKIVNYTINSILLKIPIKTCIIDVQILLYFLLEMFCVQRCSFCQKKDIQSLILTIRKYKMYLYLDFCINFIYIFNSKPHRIKNWFNSYFFVQKMWVQLNFLFNKNKTLLYMYSDPHFLFNKKGFKEFYFVP